MTAYRDYQWFLPSALLRITSKRLELLPVLLYLSTREVPGDLSDDIRIIRVCSFQERAPASCFQKPTREHSPARLPMPYDMSYTIKRHDHLDLHPTRERADLTGINRAQYLRLSVDHYDFNVAGSRQITKATNLKNVYIPSIHPVILTCHMARPFVAL